MRVKNPSLSIDAHQAHLNLGNETLGRIFFARGCYDRVALAMETGLFLTESRNI